MRKKQSTILNLTKNMFELKQLFQSNFRFKWY